MAQRALIVIRLSNLTEETSSPQRQRAVCERYCSDRGWTVVGEAQDLDVSAKYSPFERPQLKPWLDRHYEYDVIVFWRVDRLVRSVAHLATMVEWSRQHEVALVSATESQFDLTSPLGQAMAYMVSIFAEMERNAVVERTQQAFQHNYRAGKYRGGHVPLGYTATKAGDGWRLEVDPQGKAEYLTIVDRILAGERPNAIVRDLNDRAVMTHQDRVAVSNGKPAKGRKWRSSNLVRMLRSVNALGQMTWTETIGVDNRGRRKHGQPEVVRGEDGLPILRAEPLIGQTGWDRLQKALDEMNGKRPAYSTSSALLLQVIFCGKCGRPMYRQQGRSNFNYRCSSASFETSCGNKSVRLEDADGLVSTVLAQGPWGDLELHEPVWFGGDNHSDQLAQLEAQLNSIVAAIESGAFPPGSAQFGRMTQRASELSEARDKVAAEPVTFGRYEYRPTGETLSARWEGLTVRDRNQFLRDNEVKLTIHNPPREDGVKFDLVLGDVPKLLGAIDPAVDQDAMRTSIAAYTAEHGTLVVNA